MSQQHQQITLSKEQVEVLAEEVKGHPSVTLYSSNLNGVIIISTRRRSILCNSKGKYLAQNEERDAKVKEEA